MPKGHMKPDRPEAALRVCEWRDCGKTYKPIRITQLCCCHKCRYARYNDIRDRRRREVLVNGLAGEMMELVKTRFAEMGLSLEGLGHHSLNPSPGPTPLHRQLGPAPTGSSMTEKGTGSPDSPQSSE